MIVTKRELDDKDKKIIQLIMRKVSYKKMTSIVFLSRNGINHRIKLMKDYYGCETTEQLISHLLENGLI